VLPVLSAEGGHINRGQMTTNDSKLLEYQAMHTHARRYS
jgi:hypothetical protein